MVLPSSEPEPPEVNTKSPPAPVPRPAPDVTLMVPPAPFVATALLVKISKPPDASAPTGTFGFSVSDSSEPVILPTLKVLLPGV